ncbi:MAG: hypothetical protein K6E21_04725 [Bacilli bacterium]|nr:hypothetical protein [Bacilli bacterium]
MKEEIGSEFWDIPTCKKRNCLFDNATFFSSGRGAFRAILKDIKEKIGKDVNLKFAIPSYLCESMIDPLKKEGIEYEFYSVDFENGKFVFDYSCTNTCNAILLVSYFGYDSFSECFKTQHKIIVRDVTHSIFSREYDDADYYFGSLRKWAGFKNGGFAYKKNGSINECGKRLLKYSSLRNEAMKLKEEYINGYNSNKNYLDVFENAEILLKPCEVAGCISSDIDNALFLDIDFIRESRRKNAIILIEGLKKYCVFKQLGTNDCPLFVPIIFKDRDGLRKYLISKRIYCPIHWPKPEEQGIMSETLYKEELSLICDQRYDASDMNRIVCEVLKFIEGI